MNNRFNRDKWEQRMQQRMSPEWQKKRRQDRISFGIVVIAFGIFFLLRQLGMIPFMSIRSLVPFILIAVGLVIGINSRFRHHAWWILILIGVAQAVPQFTIMGKPSSTLIWPVAIIIGGIFILFRPKKSHRWQKCGMDFKEVNSTESPSLNIDVTFGGRKEIVTSKEFKGGRVAVTFAGAELNLMQADSTSQPMVLDLKVAFGGLELIVPSHWEIINEVNPSFGSVEDERSMRTPPEGEQKKTLILRGSCSFGSIEIKGY